MSRTYWATPTCSYAGAGRRVAPLRSDPYRNIRHSKGVPSYMPGCHILTDYFRHMQSRPESLYILTRVDGIMAGEGCNTSVPPGAGGLIPPSHLVKAGMLQGGIPLQRRYSSGQGVCLPLLPFPLTMRVLGNTRLIFFAQAQEEPMQKDTRGRSKEAFPC